MFSRIMQMTVGISLRLGYRILIVVFCFLSIALSPGMALAKPALLAAGLAHSVYADERGRLWAWGDGHLGQLGPQNTADSATAVRPLSRLRRVRLLAAGWSHNLVLTRSGQLLAWGFGDAGQLGVGLMAPYAATRGWVMDDTAALPNPGRLVALAAGVAHSLAVTADGALWVWGWNGSGQLGLNNSVNLWSPVMNPYINGVEKVATGGSHSLALLSTGVVMAWGANASGQLGDGTTDDRSLPQPIFNPGLDDVTALAAGQDFSLTLDKRGRLYAWGANAFGQLDLGNFQDQTTPQPVLGLPAIKAMSAGGFHVLALDAAGRLYAWGANDCGQLGDGTTAGRATPQQVLGLPPIVTMAAGFKHNLALDKDGRLWVWGSNDHLQLGLVTPQSCLSIPRSMLPPS